MVSVQTNDNKIDLSPKPRVAVLGATGFIGAYVARALAARGIAGCGIARDPNKARTLLGAAVSEWRTADLANPAALTQALDGIDVLVNCAALWSWQESSWERHYETNVLGMENLCNALAKAGVRRLVTVSTWGVYKWRRMRPIHEEVPLIDGHDRLPNVYRASKRLGEAKAWELSKSLGLELVVLRPGCVFGARDRHFTASLRRSVRRRRVWRPPFPYPLLYAGDLAEVAVTAALAGNAVAGRAFNVGGPHAPLLKWLWELRRQDPSAKSVVLPPPIPPFYWIDSRRARRELGYVDRPIAEAVRETLALDPAGPGPAPANSQPPVTDNEPGAAK